MKFVDIGKGRFYNEHCFEVFKAIPDGVFDMVLCDLPYGTTVCKWDTILDLELLWQNYWRVCKPDAAIVLTAAFPFTATLAMSEIKNFRYSLVWDKVNRYTGALNSNKMPLRRHEDILVFYKKLPTFNKQYRKGKAFVAEKNGGHGVHTQYGNAPERRVSIQDGEHHNPCSIIEIKGDVKKEHGLHPTQKPVELFEYLIKTYSNEGNLILDNCAGSGTTSVACESLNRRWVCVEKDELYYQRALSRHKVS